VPNIPNTNGPGYVFVSAGSGQNQGFWIPWTDEKDYAIGGTLVATTSLSTTPVPHQLALNGQLLSVSPFTLSGTCVIDIQQNGSGITGLTSLSVSSTPTTYTPTNPTYVAVGDLLGPIIDSVSSAVGLGVTMIYWKYLS
jgi:hypothetical protein